MSEPDLSEFEELAKPPKKRCKIADALERLPAEDAETLEAALAKDSIPPKAIIGWLDRREIGGVHYNSVFYHRTGKCQCSDDG